MSDYFMESLFRQAQRPQKGTALGKRKNEASAFDYHGGHPNSAEHDPDGGYWYGNEPESAYHRVPAQEVDYDDSIDAADGQIAQPNRPDASQGQASPLQAAMQHQPPLQSAMRQQQQMKDETRLKKIRREIAKLGIEQQELEQRLKSRN